MIRVPRLVEVVRRVLAPFDATVMRLSRQTAARRARFLRDERVGVALDVGAHVGDWAARLRASGFAGRIESVEPRGAAFERLRARAASDPAWRCHRLALGATGATATLHLADNEESSSILPMLELHAAAAPQSRYVGTEQVEVRRLDDLDLVRADERALLKLDVQGFEEQALLGADTTLAHIRLVEIELSLRPLYEGQLLIEELIGRLRARGFEPIWVERGYEDPRTGHVLQLDAILVRTRGG